MRDANAEDEQPVYDAYGRLEGLHTSMSTLMLEAEKADAEDAPAPLEKGLRPLSLSLNAAAVAWRPDYAAVALLYIYFAWSTSAKRLALQQHLHIIEFGEGNLLQVNGRFNYIYIPANNADARPHRGSNFPSHPPDRTGVLLLPALAPTGVCLGRRTTASQDG